MVSRGRTARYHSTIHTSPIAAPRPRLSSDPSRILSSRLLDANPLADAFFSFVIVPVPAAWSERLNQFLNSVHALHAAHPHHRLPRLFLFPLFPVPKLCCMRICRFAIALVKLSRIQHVRLRPCLPFTAVIATARS